MRKFLFFGEGAPVCGLNQLNDISLNREYGDICGYTEEELIKVFGGLIKGEKELEEIREWYNGYWWLSSKMYNPLINGVPLPPDVLLYLQNREKGSYWFETGNPGGRGLPFRGGGPYPRVFDKVNKRDELLYTIDRRGCVKKRDAGLV
ncbi:MAG: AAA family ATPase [Candidatus Aenigmatarchaeota archaeon]